MLTLSREDWAEIYYALDTKAKLIEDGEYGCCEHKETPDGGDCPEDCDGEWLRHLQAVMDKIGPDGTDALLKGTSKL
jgi:hypothetical protein